MNSFPSWLHKIPAILEILAFLPDERIDRQGIEQLFDLRHSAAHELLRRFGAERHGNSLSLRRNTLMARLREAQEHPDWRWERERRQEVHERIEKMRPMRAKSKVSVSPGLQRQLTALETCGLPPTIHLAPGRLTIHCRDMRHLLDQLVLLGQSLDSDYACLESAIEPDKKRPLLFPDECDYAPAAVVL